MAAINLYKYDPKMYGQLHAHDDENLSLYGVMWKSQSHCPVCTALKVSL